MDMKSLSDTCYIQGMLVCHLLFLKQLLEPFQAIIATLMVYQFYLSSTGETSLMNNDSTGLTFQVALSLMVVDTHVASVSRALLLHSCWMVTTHCIHIDSGSETASQYVF